MLESNLRKEKEKAKLYSGKVKDFHFLMNNIICKQKAKFPGPTLTLNFTWGICKIWSLHCLLTVLVLDVGFIQGIC